MNASNIQQLLRSARNGNHEALMQLLFHFHAPLLQHIQANLGEKLAQVVAADDILQETFVHAMRSIADQANDEPAGFLAWLKTIASNRIRDAARAESAKKRGGDFVRVENQIDPFRSHAGDLLAELSAGVATPSRIIAKGEAIDAMQVAISALSEDQREAIRLHCFEKLTLEQTAEAMGRSTGSVRGLIQRAKEQLRDDMDSASKWLSR